jgi:hypothetical protein
VKGSPYWILKWKLAENFFTFAHFNLKGVTVSQFITLNDDWNSHKMLMIFEYAEGLKKKRDVPSCLHV